MSEAEAGQPINHVLVCGTGWTGRQVAAQLLGHGLHVWCQDKQPQTLEQGLIWIKQHCAAQAEQGLWPASSALDVHQRLHTLPAGTPLPEPIELVIECVPELIGLKRRTLKQLSELARPDVLLTSNSSYFVPSLLAKYVVHPERYAHFHFHVPVWRATVVDIVGSPMTDASVISRLQQLAKRIGQVPLVQGVENPGYIFNWLLQSVLRSALQLVDRKVAAPEQIDIAWKTVTGMPLGPFGMMDQIGLDVIEHVLSNARMAQPDPELDRLLEQLRPLVNHGHLGIKTGRGFFDYHPEPGSEPGG